MRLLEFTNDFSPLLKEFWAQTSPADIEYYCTQNHCQYASADLIRFLESKGIHNAELVRTGSLVNGKKSKGWIKVDKPDTHYDALTTEDILTMQHQDLNPRKLRDRITYINSSPELQEEFTWIPHSWTELRGEILDPSGFLPDGQGQFDKFVTNKTNLSSRYFYF